MDEMRENLYLVIVEILDEKKKIKKIFGDN